MSRKSELPQKPRHILIFDEDWDFLEQNYGSASPGRFGIGPAIRQIVHAKVLQLRQQIIAKRDARTSLEAAAPGAPTDEANSGADNRG